MNRLLEVEMRREEEEKVSLRTCFRGVTGLEVVGPKLRR